ncbi:filamentous hemagglutinin N-terminal domain-containing protein [Erwinia sp. INIA-01]|uniref:two-partner secretion domain-containing protein n=1 Tax=Erwinia sp. INIA01 TaxID=2991500 RepID=UPI002224031D|nr:filamentous hemagglutinin N-terminal domain-containing protein [Erwinia sp. INIA01]MCW1875651.1 filamentous hemagglutinin N-terminal domain-containing protein [Erwinia sp. INIA01]
MENRNAVIRPLALAVALSFVGGASAVGSGIVVSGLGSIIKNGNQVKVQQNTDKMIVNWNNMNVGKNESLNFNQPNANAAILNKINNIDPTVIAGALNANGKVFIVNPHGVLISKGSSVNVGSLIASSLDISNKDFLSGNINLKGNGKGKIVNEGDITAAKDVALVGGGEVTNNGKIYSKYNGTALASGSDITLLFPEMGKMSVKVNKGSLNALINNRGIIISDRGDVTLTAWATDTLTRGVINNTGVLEAKGVQSLLDGGVSLSANGDINLGGQVTAHGNSSITSTKDVNVMGSVKVDGDLNVSGNNIISKSLDNGNEPHGALTSGKNMTLDAKNEIIMPYINVTDETYSYEPQSNNTNNLNVNAKNITLNNVNVKGNTNLTAIKGSSEKNSPSGNITLGDSDLEGNLTVKASGDMTLNKDMVVGSDVNITANNLLSSSSAGEYPWSPKQLNTLSAKNVNIKVDNDVNIGAIVTTLKYNNFDTDINSGNASITAKNVILDRLNTMSNLTISADKNVTIKQFNPRADYGSDIIPVAKISADTVDINKSYAYSNVQITANKDINYNNSTNNMRDTSLTSKNGNVYLGRLNGIGGTHKNLTISAENGSIDMKDQFTVTGDLSVTAGRLGMFLPSSLSVYGNAVLTTPGSIRSNAYTSAHLFFNKNLTYIVSKNSTIAPSFMGPTVRGFTRKIIKN